jgi:hypothetical protein
VFPTHALGQSMTVSSSHRYGSIALEMRARSGQEVRVVERAGAVAVAVAVAGAGASDGVDCLS